jgi:hypothetical protein
MPSQPRDCYSNTIASPDAPLFAECFGSPDTGGHLIRSGSVMAHGRNALRDLCKALLASGVDPQSALDVFDGDTAQTLFTVRNLSTAANLTVISNGKRP